MEKTANFCVIGKDIETGGEVSINDQERCNHWHVQGITGSGKTTLVIHTFLQDIQHGHGGLFITPDPDGIRDILARLPEERIKDVVLIDPADNSFPYGSNLLTCPVKQRETEVKDARDRMMHVFKKLWGPGSKDASWGPQLENVLNNCLYLLILNDLTLAELPFVLRDKDIRNYLVARIPAILPGTPDAFRWTRWFFEKDFGTWGQKLQLERTDSTLNKVLQFLTNPVIENIIGQKTTTLNMRRWMEKKKIILVNLPENTLGEDTVKLLGTMIMAQFKEAVFSRERLDKSKRVFFPATCDEFELFAGDDFQTLLVRGRKHNVAFILAHQDMAQITDESLREAVNQTGNKTTFMVTPADAKHFAPIYTPSPKPEQIEEISREEIIGMMPVRTYKQDVISHLLHQGHADRRVTEFVRGYLQELHIARLKRIEHEREEEFIGSGRYGQTHYTIKTVYPVNHLGIEYNPESLPRVFQELNIWLFEGMRERENLWQPLPDFTHWFLARFFGFKQFYTIYNIPVQSYVEASWRKIAAGDFPTLEAGDSGYGRAELFNATIAAIETALADFLTSLFPAIPNSHVRETIGQSGITTLTSAQLQEQARVGLTRISFTLLPTAYREDFDMARYIREYLTKLSVPQNATSVFLPALFTAYRGSIDTSDWRSVREVKTTETTGPENLTSMEKYGLKLVPSYDYHLEFLTDKLRLNCIQDLQNILSPFLTHLKFFSCLHSAQLALAKQPIWTMDSGQYEPEKRTMTHFLMRSRQTPSEVVGLMEQELVSLEPLSAWCRIQQPISAAGSRIVKQKVTIPLLGPGLTGADLDKRIERVRKQSRLLIAPRPANEVAEEIRGRVARLWQTLAEKQEQEQQGSDTGKPTDNRQAGASESEDLDKPQRRG